MNRYKGLNVLPIIFQNARVQDPIPVEVSLNGGIVLDGMPGIEREFGKSPDLDRVRVERKALRVDFDNIVMGTDDPPAKKIVALGEHRFVQDGEGEEFSKTFRLYPDAQDKARIDSYDEDADTWSEEVTSVDVTLPDPPRNLSWKSYFNILFFAREVDGKIFKWDNANLENDEGNDFATGNSINGVDAPTSIPVVVTPAGGIGGKYKVNYQLNITGPSNQDGFVDVSVMVGGSEVGVKRHVVPASVDFDRALSFPNQSISFVQELAAGSFVTLEVSEISAFPATIYVPMPIDVTNILGVGYPPLESTPVDGTVTALFKLSDTGTPGGTATVKLDVDYGGGPWVNIASQAGLGAGYWTLQGTVTDSPVLFRIYIDGVVNDSDWALKVASDPAPFEPYVQYDVSFVVDLHGNNEADDGDPAPGIEYSTEGEIKNTITILTKAEDSTEPVYGKYVGVMANRVVILQFEQDPQRIGWSANGLPLDYESDGAEGIGVVIPSKSDPIDPLVALASMPSNFSALFRKRSIMRAVPTGSINPAIAFYPWIEHIGTESPFSVVSTPIGIIFLSHDKNVYLLTESGLLPIGTPIFDELVRTLDESDLEDLVEAEYDPYVLDYILSVRRTENAS